MKKIAKNALFREQKDVKNEKIHQKTLISSYFERNMVKNNSNNHFRSRKHWKKNLTCLNCKNNEKII